MTRTAHRHARHSAALLLGALLLLAAGCSTTDQTAAPVTRQQLADWLRHDEERPPEISAHRGGPAPGFPENCLATFEHSLGLAPVVVELDVAMTRDSVLVLMHDETVDRTTTGSGPVDSLSYAQLRELRLLGPEGDTTAFVAPTLREALAWGLGRTVLMLDVKGSAPHSRVLALLDSVDAEGYTVFIVYSAEQAHRAHELAPEVALSVDVRSQPALDSLLALGLPTEKLIAFTGVAEPDSAYYARLHGLGLRAIVGAIGELDERARAEGPGVYTRLWERGADIVVTDRVALAAEALRDLAPRAFEKEVAR
jgi:glycerophosphoryl diester phosphodiesterase